MAKVIDGRALAERLESRIADASKALTQSGVQPGLATLIVGENYGAEAYERRLHKVADRLGCRYVAERLPEDVELADVLATVGKLNADPRVTGILILRPLPRHIPEVDVYRTLDPLKDIEAVHPQNAGLLAMGRARFTPSTPAACFYLLDEYVRESGQDPKSYYDGLTLVLVGRSNNVGKPALWLGLERNATVISCHRYTSDAGRLADFTKMADILIVAAGIHGIVTGDMVREGVIAIDVGINPYPDPVTGKTRMVGDLDFDSVEAKAEAITPVPGGVGPLTDVWLLRNTVTAAALASQFDRSQNPRHNPRH